MIRTKEFQITRPQLVRVASAHYLRRMWPIFVAFPVFGLVAMIFGPNAFLKGIGFLALLWPFTIPARVAMASWNKAKSLMRPTWVLLEDDTLYFHDDQGGGMKLPLSQVRRMDIRADCYVLETRRFNFALIPISSVENRHTFESAISKA